MTVGLMTTTMRRVLCLSGSLRRVSSNTAALEAAQRLAPAVLELVGYIGLGALPLFNPDDDVEPLPPCAKPSVAPMRC
jgi:chromate reductase, NAD(P)H dehydrogenase (quinone)